MFGFGRDVALIEINHSLTKDIEELRWDIGLLKQKERSKNDRIEELNDEIAELNDELSELKKVPKTILIVFKDESKSPVKITFDKVKHDCGGKEFYLKNEFVFSCLAEEIFSIKRIETT